MINQAVILCAGEGRRMRVISDDAKPMTWIAKRYFVEFLIEDLTRAGVKDIVLLVRYRKEDFEKVVKRHLNVRLHFQADAGTNMVDKHVLRIPRLSSKFLVANGDCYPYISNDRWESIIHEGKGGVGVIRDLDAGFAVVDRHDIETGFLSCTRIDEMRSYMPHIPIYSLLHIGTPAGLQEAEDFFNAAVQ